MTDRHLTRPRAELVDPPHPYVDGKWNDAIWDAQGEARRRQGSIGFGDGTR